MPPIRSFSLVALALALLKSRYAKNYAIASITAFFVAVFFSQLFGWILWRWILYPKFFSPLRHIPGPHNPSFFMGQFYYAQNRPNGDCTHQWLESIPNNGILRYLDIFNSERLTIVSPQGLAEVLVHKSYEFVKPGQLRKGLGRILGIGIFLAEGEEHKRQRKNLAPAFAFRHIKNLYPIFWTKGEELVAALKDFTASDLEATIDVNSWASRATLDIVGVAGLGHDFHAIADPNTDLNVTYRRLFSPSRWGRAIAILSFLFPVWIVRRLPTKRNDDMALASSVIQRTCHSLIAEKKHILQSQATTAEKEAANPDILSVALTSGGFSDDDLANQLMTFLVAGHETSAAALSFSIYELCRHPHIQARLREEVSAHLGPCLSSLQDGVGDEKSNPITADLIDAMPYLSAFVAEVLRLWPPIPITIRVADCDSSILGQHIPKGTVVMVSPWAMNRSSSLWGADSLEFKPERWLGRGGGDGGKDSTNSNERTISGADAKVGSGANGNGQQVNNNTGGAESNFAQMTFLHGPRSCIGQGFAVGELKCLVAAWVWSFKETRFAGEGYEMKVVNGIAARPGGLEVRVRV